MKTPAHPIAILEFLAVAMLSSEMTMVARTSAFAPQPSRARSAVSSSPSSLQVSASVPAFAGSSSSSEGMAASSVDSARRRSQRPSSRRQAPAPATAALQQNMELIDQLRHDANVIFSILDADGSGYISREEFSNHLQQAGCSGNFVDKLFDKMDFDGDGAISPDDFRTLYLTVPSLRTLPGMGQKEIVEEEKDQTKDAEDYETIMAAADQVFQSLDSDDSGSIDLVELKAFMSHRGTEGAPAFQDKAMENIFDLLDMNRDSRISKLEFRGAFWRYSALRQALGESNPKQ